MRESGTLTAVLVVAFTCVAVVWVAPLKPGPVSAPAAGEAPQEVRFDLTWTGLAGDSSEGGRIGLGKDEANGFGVGHWIQVNDGLVLRARGEVKAGSSPESLAGKPAILFVHPSERGLGVGSASGTGPGSRAISGGAPHGCEVVELVFQGDENLRAPAYVPPRSVAIGVGDYRPGTDAIALTLHDQDGSTHEYALTDVEPRLREVAPGLREIRLEELPGIGRVPPLARIDVRSGFLDPERGERSGGHFWLTSVTLVE